MGITCAVTRVACNTATGNQQITTTDLGGLTPKAAWLIVTEATADGTAADHVVLSIGAVTGAANRWSVCVASEHGAASSDTYRRADDNACILITLPTTGAADGIADFVSFDTNGITINWSDAPAAAYLLTVIFFAGTDLSAHANVFTMGPNVNDVVDVTDPGFQPDALLTASKLGAFDEASGSTALYSLGLVLNKSPLEQYAVAMRHTDAAAAAAIASHLTDNYGIARVETDGSIGLGGEFGSFDATGFSCTTRLDVTTSAVGYLALAFGGAVGFQGAIIDSPISIGDQAVTDPAFTPQFVMACLTQMVAIDTAYTDGSAGAIGLSAFDADEGYCSSIADEDAADPTNSQSLSDDQVINFPLHDGSAGHVATLVSFDANGWTWNFSTTQETAVKWWYLAIQRFVAAQAVAGTLITAGTVAKVGQKPAAGVLTPAGEVAKLTILAALTGAVSSAGGLVPRANKALAGALTSAGTLFPQARKALSGALTTGGDVTKAVVVSAAGALTTAGAVAIQTSKALSGVLTSSGVIARSIAMNLAGALTSAGNVMKSVAISVAGGLTSSGVVATVRVVLQAVGGTLTMAGALAKQTGKALAGVLSLAGTVAQLLSVVTPSTRILIVAAEGRVHTPASEGRVYSVPADDRSTDG